MNKNIFYKRSPGYGVLGVPLELKEGGVDDEGKFKGWGSTFGGTPDAHGDVVVKGAFKDTIAAGGRNGNGVAMLYQHRHQEPIGIWTHMEELDKGLYVEGELILDIQRAKETLSLMRKGAIQGLSIGYDFPRLSDGRRDPDSYEIVEKGSRYIRYLKKLVLWEISPVTFPANIAANVTTVKDFELCETERDWEKALREAGLSKNQAQLVVKQMKPSLREANNGNGNDEAQQLLIGLRERRAALNTI